MFWIVLVLLGCAVIAWCPGRIPAVLRKIATVVALLPIVLGSVFVGGMLVGRPQQVYWVALPILLLFGMMLAAGVTSLWPGATTPRTRPIAGLFYVGPLLLLFTLAEMVVSARGGTISGTVTFKSQPVPSGKVSILGAGGVVCSGAISPEGRYRVYRVPPGPVQIAVAAYPPPSGPLTSATTKYVAIPRRYRDFEKSALARIVTQGWQRLDLELEP